MSGINEIKEKSKEQLKMNEKRKLNLDQMFENQPVGNMDIQKPSNPEIQKDAKPVSREAEMPEIQPSIISNPMNAFPRSQVAEQPITSSMRGIQTDTSSKLHSSNPSDHVKKDQKLPTYKMTFNLTEEFYKAFNDLYAQRILKGRPTEKSTLICEAIQLLIDSEAKVK